MGGLSLRGLGRKITDVFDANSQQDQQRRVAAGQPRMYADQQRAQGVTPISNPVMRVATEVVKPAVQFANTAHLAARQAAEIPRLTTATLTDNDAAITATNRRIDTNYDRFANKNSGLLGQGSFVNDSEMAKRGQLNELAPRIAGGTLQTAATVLPVARGGSVATRGLALRQTLPKVALEGSVYGGAGSIGSQLVQEGKVNPAQVAKDTLIGGALGAALPLAGAAGRKSLAVRPSVATKVESLTPKTTPKVTLTPTDEIYNIIGQDTQKGLVKPRIPGAELYGKAQQAVLGIPTKAREKTSELVQSGVQSKSPAIANAANLPKIAFKNFGLSDKQRQVLTQRTSGIESGGHAAATAYKSLQKDVAKLGNPAATNEKIYRVLETPEFLEQRFGDATKLSPDQLSPDEAKVFNKLVELNKVRNKLNYETGIISKEQFELGKSGMHSPRIYDQELFGDAQQVGGGFLDRQAGIKRKDVTQIDPKIVKSSLSDPFQASTLRLEVALKNKANLDALGGLDAEGLLLPKAPNKNFVKLEGKKYGAHEGKYIDKQIKSQFDNQDYFNSKLGQAAGDAVDAYQGTPLGALDRLQKSFKTTLSPATGLGNVFSNIFAFSGASSVNPVTAAARMTQAAKQIAQHSKKFNANVYRAEKAGLFAGDTGRALQGIEGQALKVGQKKSLNPVKMANSIYGNTDKAFALGIFNELKARGLSDADAVLRTQRSMQNYANAGRGINALADTPVLGKPFARFTPELLRIMKNNAIYNPVGTAAKVGGLAAGANYLSNKAGETDEEREARETTVGQTQLPGTSILNRITRGPNRNVSLNLPLDLPGLGKSAVNIARLSGLNYPIEPNSDANKALIRQLSPIADIDRTDADGNTKIAPNQLVSSLALKPIADQLANRDFMSRQITDPENRVVSEIGRGKSQFENPDGTRQSPGKGQEVKNRVRTALMNTIPLANEADALSNAARGKKDYYGKERSLAQGVLRSVGLKTESNAKEVREKRVNTKDFYEGKDRQVKQFLNNNKDLADSYFKINDAARDRNTNKKASSIVGPEKWSIVKGENSGRLFSQLRREALDANAADKTKPVDPIYMIQDPKRQKEVLAIRSAAPGDNVEKEQMLRATTNWYKPFEEAEGKYFKENNEWFKTLPKSKNPAEQNDRVAAYGAIKYPEQSELVKRYYQAKASSPEAGKSYYKNNADALSAGFSNYKNKTLDYYNKKREILGLEPIKRDTYNNVTFGYEDDEAKVAKELYFKGLGGGGRGGRSGGGKGSVGSAYKYAVSLGAGGKAASVKVAQPKIGKSKIAAKTGGKPKVSVKKSLV